MSSYRTPLWPVLTSYPADHLLKLAMPLGGIGTGTVSLGGRGDLRDWEIVNHTSKGFTPANCFFALRVERPDDQGIIARLLEGPVDPSLYEGTSGSPVANAGLPRFLSATFDAGYPLGQVHLSDPDVPLRVRLEAFNPLVPGDVAASSFPVAALRYVLRNDSNRPVKAWVAGSLRNFIGRDGLAGEPGCKGNVNEYRELVGGAARGVFLRSEGVAEDSEQWGTLALAAISPGRVTHRTNWVPTSWCNQGLADWWKDFVDDGSLDHSRSGDTGDSPVASVCVETIVPALGETSVSFLLAWHFPNRRSWKWPDDPAFLMPEIVGNYYTTVHRDAWNVIEAITPELPSLEARTVDFVRNFVESDFPQVVKEASLNNLAHLRTQTCFRTADGRFFGWEGGHNERIIYNCLGTANHVWNYEVTTAFVFGELARSMRETSFLLMMDEDGAIRSRVFLPIRRAKEYELVAADGQLGSLVHLFCDWRLSGDDSWFRWLWPAAKRAMEFCWRKGSWDADGDGVMEGSQHNTLDTEYFGPNPVMAGWYLAALSACEQMAAHVGDGEFAARCRDLRERGTAWVDAHLFNGDYYQQKVRTDSGAEDYDPRTNIMRNIDFTNPPFQLANACLVDQLAGLMIGRVAGLDGLLDATHVRRTLETIHKNNFHRSLRDHFNHMRTYALADESATVMASYPLGARPEVPFPYYTEVMTGFEYTAAIHMLFEGMSDEGLELMQAVRCRYDGRRRNPFNETEWGNHYARSMVAWAAVPAITGFLYDGVSGTVQFAASDKPVKWFWSNGGAWGVLEQWPSTDSLRVTFSVHGGNIRVSQIVISGIGQSGISPARVIESGDSETVFLILKKTR